jgi:uncharacterized membrane protein (DUF485 family)
MENRAKTLDDIAADRWRISIWLTAIMMVIYFGFILLIAYNKKLLATPVIPGLSLGILLGALTIVAVWVLTYIYVHWANTTYDPHVAELQAVLRNTANNANIPVSVNSGEYLITDESTFESTFTEDQETDSSDRERKGDA